jgi:acyl-CoA synthetase (AMP-forming)/AMP-acid ligase II
VAVFGIPDQHWGELVDASVFLKPGLNITEKACPSLSPDPRELQSPRYVEVSETDLPKRGIGKLLKRLLCERFRGLSVLFDQ